MSLWDADAGDWDRLAVDADRALVAEDKLIVVGPASAVERLTLDAGPAAGDPVSGQSLDG